MVPSKSWFCLNLLTVKNPKFQDPTGKCLNLRLKVSQNLNSKLALLCSTSSLNSTRTKSKNSNSTEQIPHLPAQTHPFKANLTPILFLPKQNDLLPSSSPRLKPLIPFSLSLPVRTNSNRPKSICSRKNLPIIQTKMEKPVKIC